VRGRRRARARRIAAGGACFGRRSLDTRSVPTDDRKLGRRAAPRDLDRGRAPDTTRRAREDDGRPTIASSAAAPRRAISIAAVRPIPRVAP